MHLRGTTSQQVNERRVEGHDGVAHVYHLLLIVAISGPNGGESEELGKNRHRKDNIFKGHQSKDARQGGKAANLKGKS